MKTLGQQEFAIFTVMTGWLLFCCGLQETFHAKVLLRYDSGVRNHLNSSYIEDLFITIRAPHRKFRFHLIRKYQRSQNVPIFVQDQQGINGIHTTKNMSVSLYQDVEKKAWFYIYTDKNTSRQHVTGMFRSKTYLFTVRRKTSREKSLSYVLMQQQMEFPRWAKQEAFNISAFEELPYIQKSKMTFHKRRVILYEIELFLAVDYSIYKGWNEDVEEYQDFTEYSDQIVLEEIRSHYILLYQDINSRFMTIKGPGYMVDVLLVGIYIAHVSSASPWIHNTTYTKHVSDRPVLSSDTISLFSNWINLHKEQLPVFDHAMAFTANNLAHKENLKTLGVASQQSMCTNRSLSIIEDHGNIAYASFVASHELAHSLGAKHDGMPPTVKYGDNKETCSDEDGFIMSPKTSSKPRLEDDDRRWYFSPCSQLYFDFYIDHLNSGNTNCLLQSGRFNDSNLNFGKSLPELYSADEICAMLHGKGSVMDRVIANKNPGDVCRSIPCIKPEALSSAGDVINTLSTDGIACGEGMKCQHGTCVLKPDMFTGGVLDNTIDSCVFGDQPGHISDVDMPCTELIKDKPYNCYKYEQVCCESCRHYLRHHDIPDCYYGDRIPNCDRTMCHNSHCCETCALENGDLRTCPEPSNRPFLFSQSNTESFHHGTVATFSCSNGYHLEGPETLICLGNGTWSDNVPSCYLGCPKLVIPSAISVNFIGGNYSFGTDVHFRCLHALSMMGKETAVCMNTSKWSASVPSCILAFVSLDTIRIQENTNPGTVVHHFSTGNELTRFEMIGMSHPGFVVHDSGVVTIDDATEIDYEQVQQYRLHVKATLISDPMFTAKQVLSIMIQDVNEFTPEFEKPIYSINMPNDVVPGKRILQVHAEDSDLSTISLHYNISKYEPYIRGDTFMINSSSGEISFQPNQPIQSSADQPIRLTVTAVDDGFPQSRTGSAAVIICLGNECSGTASFRLFYSSYFVLLILHLTLLV